MASESHTDLGSGRGKLRAMRSRWLSTALAGGVFALLLGCLAPPAVASNYGYPATYKGTTAEGGGVEFEVSADGTSVTRFQATQVPESCGMRFDGIVEGAFPIKAEAFSDGSPSAGLVFSGFFPAAQRAEGTVSYRIIDLRYDGCESATVGWTASVASPPLAPPQIPPAAGPPRSAAGQGSAASSRTGVVVSYRQEGGIGGPRPSLVVSKGRRARVTLGRCTAKLALRPRAWRKLRVAVRDADIQAIAGDYPPPAGSADEITYVIRTRAGTVRIAPSPEPRSEEVMRRLKPLLKVLNGLVWAGERGMPSSCRSSR